MLIRIGELLKFIGVLLVTFPGSVGAQTFPRDATTGKIYYAEEVLVKDGPQLELYYRAKAWFVKNAKTKNAIIVDDLSNGVLMGTTYLLLPLKNQTYRLWYTLKIEMEDDRYWYSLTDFKIQKHPETKAAPPGNMPPPQPLEAVGVAGKSGSSATWLPDAVQPSILTLIQQIKKNMN